MFPNARPGSHGDGLDREMNNCRGTNAPRTIVEAQLGAVSFRDLAANRQAQSKPMWLGRHEWLECALLHRSGYPGALIDNFNAHGDSRRSNADADTTPIRRCLDRVLKEIPEQPSQS